MSMYMTFRQVPSPTLTLQNDRVHSSPRYIGPEKTSDYLIRKKLRQMLNSNHHFSREYPRKRNQLYHKTQHERWKIEEGSELSLDAAEHISDRLSRYNRNNSQSDLSDYASSVFSSIREHKSKIDVIHS